MGAVSVDLEGVSVHYMYMQATSKRDERATPEFNDIKLSETELQRLTEVREGLDPVAIIVTDRFDPATLQRMEIEHPEEAAYIFFNFDRLPPAIRVLSNERTSKVLTAVDQMRWEFDRLAGAGRSLTVYETGDVPNPPQSLYYYADGPDYFSSRTHDKRDDLDCIVIPVDMSKIVGSRHGAYTWKGYEDEQPKGLEVPLTARLVEDADKLPIFSVADYRGDCPVWLSRYGRSDTDHGLPTVMEGLEGQVLLVNLHKLTARPEIGYAAINLIDRWADSSRTALLASFSRDGKVGFYKSGEELFGDIGKDPEPPLFAVAIMTYEPHR